MSEKLTMFFNTAIELFCSEIITVPIAQWLTFSMEKKLSMKICFGTDGKIQGNKFGV